LQAETIAAHRAGHADEGDAAQRRAHHAERDQHPVAALVTDEEAVVIGVARGAPGHHEQQAK
jgi:hypothetical protein